MVDLAIISAIDGLLPLTIGTTNLTEATVGAMTSLAPYRGQTESLSSALKSAHGMAAPANNRTTGKEGARAIWFGRDMFLLVGPDPDPALAEYAALSDQSDAWCVVRLTGEHAADVLARLTPVDLRTAVFKRGHTARTELKHMMASITRIGDQNYQIMVFRGFGKTLLHDLQLAMEGVAARGGA